MSAGHEMLAGNFRTKTSPQKSLQGFCNKKTLRRKQLVGGFFTTHLKNMHKSKMGSSSPNFGMFYNHLERESSPKLGMFYHHLEKNDSKKTTKQNPMWTEFKLGTLDDFGG